MLVGDFDRVCMHCGLDFGREGPLPYIAGVHTMGGVLMITCSKECRAALGLTTHRRE